MRTYVQRSLLKVSLGVLAVSLATFAAREALGASGTRERSSEDEADLEQMRRNEPSAADLLLKGEAEWALGDVATSAELFEKARRLAPRRALAARRHCQALAELGRRAAAIEACKNALTLGGSGVDERALVQALVSGNEPPTPQDLTQAFGFVDTLKERMEHQPWGYAAECDILRRFGTPERQELCLQELARRTPGHYEALRARALATPVSFRWLAYAALALAWLLTLGHALRRALSVRSGRAAPALALLLVGLTTSTARAADPVQATQQGSTISKWPINHDDPEKSLPTPEQRDGNPLEYGYHLMDLTEAGTAASSRGDHAQAVKYFVALAKAVPDVARGYILACSEYQALGNREEALRFCTTGILKQGPRIMDYKLYAGVMLSKPTPLDAGELSELTQVIAHLRENAEGLPVAEDIACGLALKLQEPKQLEQCVGVLRKRDPNSPATITHEFALALARHDPTQAAQVIERARKSGVVPPAALAQMERARNSASIWRRWLGDWRLLGIPLALLVAGPVLLLSFRRRRNAAGSPQSANA